MSTYSSDLRIELIANGAQAGTWGTTTNDTWAYVIDPSITGFQTVAVSSANQALTYVSGSTSTASANQAIYASLAFTTSTGANFNVYAPPNPKQYIIWNNSSYTLTIYNSTVLGNTTAAGAGVAVPAGKKVQVFSTGTNFYSVDAANLTGTLAIANGGTGQTTQQAAINALAGATTSAQYLRGNGTNVTMSAIQASDVPTLNQNTTGTAAGLSSTLVVGSGGTGATSLSGVVYGNGSSAFTAATGSQIASAIGSSTVTNATNATNATNVVSGGTIASNVTATTQSVGTNNTTVATTAFVQANGGFGVSQSWTSDLGPSGANTRAFDTTYTNTTGKPIMVAICSNTPGAGTVYLTIGGVLMTQQSMFSGGGKMAYGVVPNNTTYLASANNGGGITTWCELS